MLLVGHVTDVHIYIHIYNHISQQRKIRQILRTGTVRYADGL